MRSTSSTAGTATSPRRAWTANGEGARALVPSGPASAGLSSDPAHTSAIPAPMHAAPACARSFPCRDIRPHFTRNLQPSRNHLSRLDGRR